MGVAVVVAGAAVAVGRGRVGTPLDHAEGRGRAGEVVAAAESVVAGPGAGEDVDVVGQAGSGGGLGCERERGERRGDEESCACEQALHVTALA